MRPQWIVALVAGALLGSCHRAEAPQTRASGGPTAQLRRCEDNGREDDDAPSLAPSGAPEVDVRWLAAHRCGVRVIDVREADEYDGPGGHIDVAERVSPEALATRAEPWPRGAPVVLVCRSGRRSARAVETLQGMGFTRVASLTGGMLSWQREGLATTATVHVSSGETPPRTRAPELGPEVAPELAESLAAPGALRWVQAASLLGGATVSCIDGRAETPVLGTPGGDLGELVLSLAALEDTLHRGLTAAEVEALVGAYGEAFGRLYLHTDRHALERLMQWFHDHPETFQGVSPPRDLDALGALVRHPPAGLEAPLRAALTAPAHIGCGHLRLMTEHPARYGLRPGLVGEVLGATLTRAWRHPEGLEFAVLEGEHRERGVLEVALDAPVHAHSWVPMVTPHRGAREVFVMHPQVASFLRAETAWFLIEHLDPAEARRVDPQRLTRHIEALGERQRDATIAALAPHLPHHRLLVSARAHQLVRVARD